jgi:nucleotide-binding universal stress UspA family protein
MEFSARARSGHVTKLQEAHMYHRVLTPLDGSKLAEQALPHALEIARCMGAGLWLVRVCLAQFYVHSPAGTGPLYTEDVLEAEKQAGMEYLARVRARLQNEQVTVTTQVLAGPVAETIIDYAREQNIDLIVMSTHGRSGFSRWVYGSVTDRVLRGAHCPTLIIRAQPAT